MESKEEQFLPKMRVQHTGSESLDLVAWLRSAEALVPCKLALQIAGIAFLATGLLQAAYRFLAANTYLLFIFAGIACLAASLLADREGLLCYLPEGVRQFLLKTTIFDFLHDDAAVTNATRKWGRVLLLAKEDGQSEGKVRSIVEGMEPEFADMVLRRNIVSLLPSPLPRILLSEAAFVAASTQALAPGIKSSTLTGSSGSSGSRPSESVQAVADGGPLRSPSVSWITAMLRERHQEKERSVTEPEIAPLVNRVMGLESALKPVRTYGRMLFNLFEALCLSAASGWFVSAGLFHYGSGAKVLARGLASSGLMRRTLHDSSLKNMSRFATAISLLSAGGAVVLSLYFGRFGRLLQEIPDASCATEEAADTCQARTWPFEPEREESPPDSEASPQEEDVRP